VKISYEIFEDGYRLTIRKDNSQTPSPQFYKDLTILFS